jgi:hypothetical protein
MRKNNEITAVSLTKMSHQQLLHLFKTLDAPSINEMHGEYRATLLKQPGFIATLSGYIINNPILNWQTKSFRPVSEDQGRGYNTFLRKNRIIQKFPMQTVIAHSRYDAKPVYQLIYKSFHSLCADINMVDEVRKINEHLYLGIGTWGFSEKQQHIAYPFMLEGPIHAYRKDIGIMRSPLK